MPFQPAAPGRTAGGANLIIHVHLVILSRASRPPSRAASRRRCGKAEDHAPAGPILDQAGKRPERGDGAGIRIQRPEPEGQAGRAGRHAGEQRERVRGVGPGDEGTRDDRAAAGLSEDEARDSAAVIQDAAKPGKSSSRRSRKKPRSAPKAARSRLRIGAGRPASWASRQAAAARPAGIPWKRRDLQTDRNPRIRKRERRARRRREKCCRPRKREGNRSPRRGGAARSPPARFSPDDELADKAGFTIRGGDADPGRTAAVLAMKHPAGAWRRKATNASRVSPTHPSRAVDSAAKSRSPRRGRGSPGGHLARPIHGRPG